MAGIGIHARTYVDPYEWPDTQLDHQRTNAYVPIATESIDRLYSTKRPAEADIQKLANLWIDGYRSGKLKPLTPIDATELTSAGTKSKIFDTSGMISRQLVRISDEQIESGNMESAATNLTLASDVLNSLKYSDFMYLFRTTLQQHNVLTRFEQIYGRLNASQRKQVNGCMMRMKGDLNEFAKIAKNARQLILASMESHQHTHLAYQAASRMVPESSYFELPALAKEKNEDKSEFLDNQDFMFPNLRIEARQCMLAEERKRLMIQKIMSLPSTTDRA